MDGTTVLVEPQFAVPGIPGEGGDASAAGAPLTFGELNRRLSAMPDYEGVPRASRRLSQIGLLTTLLAYLAAVVVQHLPITGVTKLTLLVAILAIECAGLAVNLWFRRGEFVDVVRPFEELAKQLDHDFPHHFELRDWLVSQPMDRLEQYASMAAFRRERYAQKLPMLAGSVSSLGVIPVLVAVYFQGRQILEGHHMSWIDLCFGFALLLFYVLTWTTTLTKSRLEAIDMHLQGALAEAQKRAPYATPD